jgi:hypothetical protein
VSLRSHSIAKGAAYAMANPLTVEEFLGRSAIGLQMRQSDANMWDDESQVLFFKVSLHPLQPRQPEYLFADDSR